jgi:SAM-dependent methyltransferase
MPVSTIYEHPLYYDILFGFDRSHEAAFYAGRLERLGIAAGAAVLEVGCGPARVGRLLARKGLRVTGLDASTGMLEFARRASAAEGTKLETLCGDMGDFSCERAFAAAINPLSSFRLLHSDDAALAHLRCMSAALQPGGVYLVDLTLLSDESEPTDTTDEAWEMSRGAICVRADNDAITVRDGARELRLSWGVEAHLRGYTAPGFEALVGASPALELESWHPESSRATGVSEFPVEGQDEAPPGGRTMVVLRRR